MSKNDKSAIHLILSKVTLYAVHEEIKIIHIFHFILFIRKKLSLEFPARLNFDMGIRTK